MFDPHGILAGEASAVTGILVLLVGAVALFVGAITVFEKKDLHI